MWLLTIMEPLFDKLARQISRHRKARRFVVGIVKFVISMIVMTNICTWAWDGFLNGKVYMCTDGGADDYFFPGDWVHAHDGHPIVVVPKIVAPHDMSDPDTIKQGWSVTGLWCVWITFFGASLIVSFVLACVSWVGWIGMLDRLAERRHGHVRAA
jgi:hypothetical protein